MKSTLELLVIAVGQHFNGDRLRAGIVVSNLCGGPPSVYCHESGQWIIKPTWYASIVRYYPDKLVTHKAYGKTFESTVEALAKGFVEDVGPQTGIVKLARHLRIS